MDASSTAVPLRPADPTIEQVDLSAARAQVQRAADSLAAGFVTAATLDLEDAVTGLRGVLARRDREAGA